MQVPHYHKKRSMQILFVGIFIGSIVAYLVLLFMFSSMYEKVLSQNIQLQTEINELERQNKALIQDKENLEEKSEPTILSISISFTNNKKLKLDRLISHQLEDLLKDELSSLLGKNVDSIAENDILLETLIENKTLTIDDLSFQFEVKKLFFSKNMRIILQVNKLD